MHRTEETESRYQVEDVSVSEDEKEREGKEKMITRKLFSDEEYRNNMDLLLEIMKSREPRTTNTEEITGLMMLFQIARTADALEEIVSKMERLCNSVELLEKLSDCVDEPLPLVGGSQFCIKGNMIEKGVKYNEDHDAKQGKDH